MSLSTLFRISALALGMAGSDYKVTNDYGPQIQQSLEQAAPQAQIQQTLAEYLQRRVPQPQDIAAASDQQEQIWRQGMISGAKKEISEYAVFGFVSYDDFEWWQQNLPETVEASRVMGGYTPVWQARLRPNDEMRNWVQGKRIFYVCGNGQRGNTCGHLSLAHARQLSLAADEGFVNFDNFLSESREYQRQLWDRTATERARYGVSLSTDQIYEQIVAINDMNNTETCVMEFCRGFEDGHIAAEFDVGKAFMRSEHQQAREAELFVILAQEDDPIPDATNPLRRRGGGALDAQELERRHAAVVQLYQQWLQEDFNRLREGFPERKRVLNFICHTTHPLTNGERGPHWVLISVVQLPGREEPCMLIFDSASGNVDREFSEYVKLIHREFIERPNNPANGA